jgi:hypothetical protein
MQVATYNFHLGLLRPSLWVRHRKVYSERREADVVMTSSLTTGISRISIDWPCDAMLPLDRGLRW